MGLKKCATFRNKSFIYEGALSSLIKVYPLDTEGDPTGTIVPIDGETIEFIKNTINEKNRVQMGACRDNPPPNSLGKMLYDRGRSPQWLSYILPLLEEAGFLTHYKDGRAFWVKKI